MRKEVGIYMAEYEICQRNKDENVLYPRLLQPLLIPSWDRYIHGFYRGVCRDFSMVASHAKHSRMQKKKKKKKRKISSMDLLE